MDRLFVCALFDRGAAFPRQAFRCTQQMPIAGKI